MKTICWILGCQVLLTIAAATGWSHGTEGRVDKAEGYCATARYDDGEPMAYAAVEVRSPGSEIAFQKGRTDRNGRFMIYPDQAGSWQIVVKDPMGHRLALDLVLSGNEAGMLASGDSPARTSSNGMGRMAGAVTGLAIIFGLCGVLYGLRSRRAARQKGEDKDPAPFF